MIETPRLFLRQWEARDLEPWIAMNADPVVMEFSPNVLSRERSEEPFGLMQRSIEQNGYGWFAVEVKSTGAFAGIVAVGDFAGRTGDTDTRPKARPRRSPSHLMLCTGRRSSR